VNLKNLEYWVLAQMVLEFGLIALVTVFLWRLRSWNRQLAALQEERRSGEELARGLLTQLEEKRQVVEALLTRLEQQAAVLTAAPGAETREAPPAAPPPPWESGASLRARVETLYRQGCSTEEIARRLQMNLAEVKVALDLSRARLRR
jgi:DNA-directed RNA polymerase specialized sigma24 family protein